MEPQYSKTYIAILGILVLAGLVLGYFIVINNFRPSSKSISNTPPPPSLEPAKTPTEPLKTPEAQLLHLKEFAERSHNLKFPIISKENTITTDKLPADLAFFLPTTANTPATASSLVFSDNSLGYKVSFAHNQPAPFTYIYFRNLSLAKYDFITGLSDGQDKNGSSVMVLEKDNYLYEIDMLPNTSAGFDITIISSKK